MATPMTAKQFAAALRREGLTVKERAGWSTHNRNSRGAWGPLNGVMIHHTASGDGPGIVDVCYRGRSDLPGPLCHGVVHKDGTVTLVGWGRANHAGTGDSRALTAVINESSTHPRPGAGNVDGNSRFVGFECVNRGDGRDPWPEKQLDAIARAAAAVCRHYGWNEHSVIGHLEWTNQKPDPRGFTMSSMRSRIAKLLKGSAGAGKPKLPKVSLRAVVYGATHKMADEKKHPSYADDVTRVQDALVAKGKLKKGTFIKGIFDVPTKSAYSAYQRSLGYRGADADGVPGITSLTKLGSGRFQAVDD